MSARERRGRPRSTGITGGRGEGDEVDPALWCLPAPTAGTGRRGGRRRTPTACRGCRAMTVAMGTTENDGENARAEGKEGAAWIWGERERRRGREGERGRVGEGPEEAGALATLSSPASVPARWSGGSAPLFRPGSGEQGRRRQGEAGRFGRVGQVAGAVASWAFRPRGEGGFLLFPFLFLFFFCSVLFNLGI